ncbi:hypothetical protein NL428_27850, partial [Klebsiella pneumoniae]|nr:hypothetical protein [Klebsiella pneumoniae]
AGNPRLFAVLEVGRPLAVRWGEDDRAPLGTLGYRKFYHPRAHGDAATWAAFESAGTFAPACSREYGASSVTVSPAARRPV